MEAEVINQLNNTLNDLEKRSEDIRVYMDYQGKKDRLEEVIGLSEDPELWNDPKRAQEIGKERKILEGIERKGFKIEILEEDDGEIAGINRATIRVEGEYAYGLLRTETGVHRLVRYSPFDSNNKRHTSFSSVFVYPEIDDSIEIEINPADLRIDTYRASGAGGQHINKTDSAVRITHEPTGIVVQCQNDRSQHANKAAAMEMLKSKLYELEMRKRNEEKQALEEGKSDVGWGSQIRSYVLDSSRIKDLRTGYEVGNTKAVLDGDLDGFIEASLKQGV